MFNKALFKQSCKANGVMWSIITAAVCFMLACVMLISGSGKIGDVKNSVEDTIITETIDASIKNTATSNYQNIDEALVIFDENFANEIKNNFLTRYQETGNALTSYTKTCTDDAPTVYANAINSYQDKLEEYTLSIDTSYTKDSEYYQQLYSMSMFVINPNGQLNDTYNSYEPNSAPESGYNVTPLFTKGSEDLVSWLSGKEGENVKEYIHSDERNEYHQEINSYALPIVISHTFTTDEYKEKMIEALEEYGVDNEKYDSFGYTYKKVKNLCSTSIVTYQARLDYEYSQIKRADFNSDAEYEEARLKAKSAILMDINSSLINLLPSDVSDALMDIGKTDLYGLIVGSIFFKMAGLLLPIIYMIMASNNLISSQVDSGSMAYVLSTSTKREEVTFTQGVYLIGSLLAMFLCTTITSLVCFSLVNVTTTSLTYGKLVLMNLGAFLVLFAMSGINFLTSCVFDRSKRSMAIGGGLSMFFLVATMLGLFGSQVIPSVVRLDSLNYFNYVSIISFFDVVSILNGTTAFIWKLLILAAIGITGYIVGSITFKKKDLPL